MVKTVSPGSVEVPRVGPVVLNAVPDPFDERDLAYRPRLQQLPDSLDRRPGKESRRVLRQEGQSCVGHAVAAMVNAALAHRTAGGQVRVSPYMLYSLARRYDEFPGEEDAGSSLRGALKGWYHHGVVSEDLWPALGSDVDLESSDCLADAAERPLGAFYRVNPFRLDDMQSALNELDAVVATAVVHTGWLEPRHLRRGRRDLRLIARPVDAGLLGGHAFVLVGYNDVGFLVQNSWGTEWGQGGFATLPYEDWLDTAYDAWVARPGVPRTPFASGRGGALVTGGERALGPAPDLRRLAAHVVNLGNDGALSATGRFASDRAQLDRMIRHMGAWHDQWQDDERGGTSRVVLYAHGGLTSEAGGLAVAQKHLNWWLNNRVYPITFAWQTGVTETLLDSLVDLLKGKLPAGGLGFDLVEQFDRLVEKAARSRLTWAWDQMKTNARLASAPPEADGDAAAVGGLAGGTLLAELLGDYVASREESVEIHLVGHSAGSIFHAALLPRLVEQGLTVRSIALLAPALRVDEFDDIFFGTVVGADPPTDLSLFLLDEQRELDDKCGVGGVDIYQKSLLYLVSRAFERGANGRPLQTEVPLLGLAKFLDERLSSGDTVRAALERVGAIAIAPADSPYDQRTDSRTHGGFDDDGPTMTSVLARILRCDELTPRMEYRANSALRTPVPAEPAAQPVPPAREQGEPEELARPVQVRAPGEAPVLELAEAQTERQLPPRQSSEPVLEVVDAPVSGAPVVDLLQAGGWAVVGPPERTAEESVDPSTPG